METGAVLLKNDGGLLPLARELGISRPTLDRLFAEYENESAPV